MKLNDSVAWDQNPYGSEVSGTKYHQKTRQQ